MGYENCGSNPNSKAALNKGMNVSKLMYVDTKTRELANIILDKEVEYNGEKMVAREAILRQQLDHALCGDLRACQFLIELAERKEQTDTNAKTATMNPLEQLQAMMQKRKIDDRRRKT